MGTTFYTKIIPVTEQNMDYLFRITKYSRERLRQLRQNGESVPVVYVKE